MKINRKKSERYWRVQRNAFLGSFRNIADKASFKAMLYDFLTIVAIIIIANTCFLLINLISTPALPELLNIYELRQSGNEEAFQQAVVEFAPVINRVLWLSLLTIIIGFLLLVFFISLFYGRAWNIRLKKRFNAFFLRRYYGMNFVWLIAWIILFLITVNFFVTTIAAFIVLIEFLFLFYSDPALRTVFDEKKNLKENFSRFFSIVKKIGWFLPFIIIGLLLMIILLLLTGLLTRIPVLFGIVFLILAILFVGWVRNYIILVVKNIRT